MPKSDRGAPRGVASVSEEQVKRARRELDKYPDLRRKYERLVKIVAGLATTEVRRKHAIGLAVDEMQKDEKKYGKKSVATLATLLAVDKSTLNDYARVAGAWLTPRKLEAVLREKNAIGVPITFSHLVELAGFVEKKRDHLLALVRKNNLTVEQLRVVIRGPKPESAAVDEATRVRHEAARWREHLDQIDRGTAWVIERASKNPTKAVLDELKDLAELQRQLATKAERNAQRLDQERARLSKHARATG